MCRLCAPACASTCVHGCEFVSFTDPVPGEARPRANLPRLMYQPCISPEPGRVRPAAAALTPLALLGSRSARTSRWARVLVTQADQTVDLLVSYLERTRTPTADRREPVPARGIE